MLKTLGVKRKKWISLTMDINNLNFMQFANEFISILNLEYIKDVVAEMGPRKC